MSRGEGGGEGGGTSIINWGEGDEIRAEARLHFSPFFCLPRLARHARACENGVSIANILNVGANTW